jgi:crotonobetainyl-CoA:carnitine CoA-transferase CaiB-like acyl-CoA transferase
MDAVPALGAHNRPILSELGFSAADIQAMAKANLIEEGTP